MLNSNHLSETNMSLEKSISIFNFFISFNSETKNKSSSFKFVSDKFNDVLSKTGGGRCKVIKVECFEHGKNSSIYEA